MTHNSNGGAGLKAWLLLIALSLVWGSSFILMKKGLEVYTSGEIAMIRMISAAAFFAPVLFKHIKKLKPTRYKDLIISGFLGSFIPAFLFPLAQTRLDSSVTGVLNALTPLFVLIIGLAFYKQKFRIATLTGLIMAFAGASFLILAGSGWQLDKINYFAFFVVLATICYGINVNLISFRLSDLSPVTISSISLFSTLPVATIYLFGFTDFVHKTTTVDGAWLALSYLVLLGMIGTAFALVLFNKLLKISNPIFSSSVTYIIPIVAVGWGLLDGEQLLIAHYAGMVLILIGVFVTNRTK